MTEYPRFFRWLVVVAMADWLLGRTLSRSAIFMPKSPAILTAYQVMNASAQFAATATALLANVALVWIVWSMVRRSQVLLAAALAAYTSIGLIMLFLAPVGWLPVAVHVLVILALLGMAPLAMSRSVHWTDRLAWALPASAVAAGQLYHAAGAWQTVLRLPGPSPTSPLFFNLGEVLVVATGILLGWVYALRAGRRRVLLAAGIPGLAFCALFLAAPAISGVLAIWSVGLTLFLPWPLYAISLVGWTAAVVALLAEHKPAGMGLALLIAGGYAPQLSLHLNLILIALWLLAGGVAGRPLRLPDPRLTLKNPWRRSAQPEG